MGMPLTADENAALMQRLGWTTPPAAPPPMVAQPPPAVPPPPAAPSPLDQALVDLNGGPRAPAPRPASPPSANAHVAGSYDSRLAPEQTVGFSGPRPNAPPAQAPDYVFQGSTGGEGGGVSGGSSRTVQKGVNVSDEAKRDVNDARALGLSANSAEQDAQTALTAAKVQGAEKQAKLYGEQANAERVLAGESDEALARKRAHIDQIVADVQNDKVDPEHFWHSRSTGQQIAIGLSMIAGGFAGGWMGTGKNGAADMLDRSIQNDIHAQEENLANKRAGVQQQSQLYEMARGEFHDRQERMRAMHVTALAQVGKEIDARIAEASDPIERARLQSARAGILEKAGESRLKLDEMGSDRVSTTTHSSFTAAPKQGPSRKEFDALTEKLVTEKNMSSNEAHILAAKTLQLPGAPSGDGSAPAGKGGKPGEKEEAQGVLDANLKAINAAKRDIGKVTEGGTAGAFWAHAPKWVPGATEATKNVDNRETYNNRARVSIAAAYKLGTDATEPKNAALLNKYAEPYEIKPGDSQETALNKMDNLEQFLIDNAAAKGASPSGATGAASYSYLKPSGGAR